MYSGFLYKKIDPDGEILKNKKMLIFRNIQITKFRDSSFVALLIIRHFI